jgi:ketosteroid isomerase-like protein
MLIEREADEQRLGLVEVGEVQPRGHAAILSRACCADRRTRRPRLRALARVSNALASNTSSVPSTNVDLVRSVYAAWGRGDFRAVEWAHPDIEFVMPDGPSPARAVGLAEMREVWREVLGAWQDFRAELEECRELDRDRVLVLTRNSGRGKTSGLDVGQIATEGANVFHIHGGRATKLVAYFERERALADLGLAPPEAQGSAD